MGSHLPRRLLRAGPGPFLSQPVAVVRLPSRRLPEAGVRPRGPSPDDRSVAGGLRVHPGADRQAPGDLRVPLPRGRGASAPRAGCVGEGGPGGRGPVRDGGGAQTRPAPDEAPGGRPDRGAGPLRRRPSSRGHGGSFPAGVGRPRRGDPLLPPGARRAPRRAGRAPSRRNAASRAFRRDGDGEIGSPRAELQLRHRHRLSVRNGPGGGGRGRARRFAARVFRPAWRGDHPDRFGSDGGWVRFPRGPAAAPRRDPRGARELAPLRRDLLRVVGADLGARGAHQGVPRGGGPLPRGGVPPVRRPLRVPQVPRLHRDRGDQGDEGPDQPRGVAVPSV